MDIQDDCSDDLGVVQPLTETSHAETGGGGRSFPGVGSDTCCLCGGGPGVGNATDGEGAALTVSEPFQRCRSKVRTALAIEVIRFGLQRACRKIRHVFSRVPPRSTRTRVRASAWTVFWVWVSSWWGRRLMAEVSQGPALW